MLKKFDIENEKYDRLLFCVGVISRSHVELENAIPEFNRLLKPGGIAIYTVSGTLDKVDALKKYLKFFYSQQFELLRIEKRIYKEEIYGDVYVIKNLKSLYILMVHWQFIFHSNMKGRN